MKDVDSAPIQSRPESESDVPAPPSELPDAHRHAPTLVAGEMAGMRLQVVVRRETWQGARLAAGGDWALLGCTVAPGFEYADYEHYHHTPCLKELTSYHHDAMMLP